MTINDYEIQPLFVEPIFTADIGQSICQQQIDSLKNLKMVRNKTNLISENLYDTAQNVIVPKKNNPVLFASGLQLFVELNKASTPRYSIAFNTFIKGKLGNYRDVSELYL